LNISFCQSLFELAAPAGTVEGVFPRLQNLIMLNTSISTWRSIDALEVWTNGRLQNLRISLSGVDDTLDNQITGSSNSKDPTKMTGLARLDRPLLIAKLTGLVSLNSTLISATERKDAELHYVKHVSKLVAEGHKANDWGRYEALNEIHGGITESHGVKSTSLRSKMISKSSTFSHKIIQLLTCLFRITYIFSTT